MFHISSLIILNLYVLTLHLFASLSPSITLDIIIVYNNQFNLSFRRILRDTQKMLQLPKFRKWLINKEGRLEGKWRIMNIQTENMA